MAARTAAVCAGHAAQHGGIHIENKAMDREVIVKSDLIQVYPSEHGNLRKLDGGKAKVSLLHSTEKMEVAWTRAVRGSTASDDGLRIRQ